MKINTLRNIHKFFNQYTVAFDIDDTVGGKIFDTYYVVVRKPNHYELYIEHHEGVLFKARTQKAIIEELDKIIFETDYVQKYSDKRIKGE